MISSSTPKTGTGIYHEKIGVFIDENFVAFREQTIGKRGILPGRELATTFNYLRPNDLVWNYVVTLAFVWGQGRAESHRAARRRTHPGAVGLLSRAAGEPAVKT